MLILMIFRGSVDMGIPLGFPHVFSVGIEWVWGLKYNPNGSPEKPTSDDTANLLRTQRRDRVGSKGGCVAHWQFLCTFNHYLTVVVILYNSTFI